jgi:threonine synthase
MPEFNFLTQVNCLECGHSMAYQVDLDTCSNCGSSWLDAEYDYDKVCNLWRDGIKDPDRSLWRYSALLPPVPNAFKVSMGEGGTPLIRVKKLEAALGHPTIYVKDERQMPTNSFKDRQGSVAVSVLLQRGIRECVLASTGNAAVAYAAYTACADIKLWVFLNSQVPAEKMREVALYGAEVIKVTGTYDESKKVAADFAKRRHLHLDKGAKAIAGKESMKTLAYEIAEQFARLEGNTQTPWQAPDWFIQAVSGGIGPLGVLKGFQELYNMGLIDRVPKIGVVQTAGCAPMVRAMANNEELATPVMPESRIVVLSTGDPGLAYPILRRAQLENGGAMTSVTDEEAFNAMRHLARLQGISVEPATAVAFAGLKKLLDEGHIALNETVVVNCSGHTFPVEKHIMDDQMVVDMKLSNQAKSHEAGLAAALDQLDEQITSVAIVDDNELDRLLVKRVLQNNKPYRVFEASGGAEGIELVEARLPDLVILDLNMPEVDGFMVLKHLKSNPATEHIPVVVISAKELTPAEKRFLEGNIASHWQKGSFSTHVLLDELISTIKTPREPETANVFDALHSIDKTTYKVIIIDDNPDDIRVIRRILESQRKYQIQEAENGSQGLKLIKQEAPDLIILDLTMPEMDGFDVMGAIKVDPRLSKIPIIVLTGMDLSVAERRQLSSETTSVLKKGEITMEKLVSQVDSKLS